MSVCTTFPTSQEDYIARPVACRTRSRSLSPGSFNRLPTDGSDCADTCKNSQSPRKYGQVVPSDKPRSKKTSKKAPVLSQSSSQSKKKKTKTTKKKKKKNSMSTKTSASKSKVKVRLSEHKTSVELDTMSLHETSPSSRTLILSQASPRSQSFDNTDSKRLCSELLKTIQADATSILGRRLIKSFKMKPIVCLRIEDKMFYFSDAVYEKEIPRPYLYIVMYVVTDGDDCVRSRLLYKSHSDGGWRVTPWNAGAGLMKGRGIHYTQETKLATPIVQLLDRMASKWMPIGATTRMVGKRFIRALYTDDFSGLKSIFTLYSFDIDNPFDTWQNNKENDEDDDERAILSEMHKWVTYADEIHPYHHNDVLKSFTECAPGTCFMYNRRAMWPAPSVLGDQKTFVDYIKNVVNPSFDRKELEDFLPDFTKQPAYTYNFAHSILSAQGGTASDIRVSVYHSYLHVNTRRDTIEWHMAVTPDNQIWIERIRLQNNNPISTYGTDTVVIDSGILTNKPIEYRQQLNRIQDPVNTELITDVIESGADVQLYANIVQLLRHLRPIKLFEKHHKL